jgi:hypothetical protein
MNHGSQSLLARMDQSQMRPIGVSGTLTEAPSTLLLAEVIRCMEDVCSLR